MDLFKASTLESLGALWFLAIALMGLAGGYFFLNLISKGKPFTLPSAGIIPLCNIAICIKVGAGLFLIFMIVTMFQPGRKK